MFSGTVRSNLDPFGEFKVWHGFRVSVRLEIRWFNDALQGPAPCTENLLIVD